MRVLLASSSSGSQGGGELFLAYLGGELAARGHHVILWCSDHPRMDGLASRCSDFCEIVRVAYRNTYDRPGRILAASLDRATPVWIASSWKALRPDVIHINKQNLEDGVELLAASNLCLADAPSPRGVCTIHITQTARFLGAKGAWLRDRLARRALRCYRGSLVAVGPRRREDLVRFLGADDSRVLAALNGVSMPGESELSKLRLEKRNQLGLGEGPCMLAVGRMVAQKRPLLFLDHAARLHRSRPGTRFIWVGDGNMTDMWDRRVRELGLGSVVSRVSWVDDPLPWYAAADILLHTAQYEGLPLALLEAMGAGLPCVVADEILPEGDLEHETGVVALSRTAVWECWLDDAEARRRAGVENRRLALQRFSVEAMADRYEAVYRDPAPAVSC